MVAKFYGQNFVKWLFVVGYITDLSFVVKEDMGTLQGVV